MKDKSWLLSKKIAHRGLHDNKTIGENSLSAFSLAVAHDFGVELDVYLTHDGKLVVHHDKNIKRTTSIDGNIYNIDGNNLKKYKLFGTADNIPLLSDVLDIIDGKVPIILEIKSTPNVNATCEAIYNMIAKYNGHIAIESFSTKIVNWWLKHHNEYVIGQLYERSTIQNINKIVHRQYKKVDFVALPIDKLASKYYRKIKSTCPDLTFISWTIRTPQHLIAAKKYADNYIFEYNAKDESYINLNDIV